MVQQQQQLSVKELAERAGLDEAALAQVETGRSSNPTFDTTYRIAAALGKVIHLSFQDAPKEPQPLASP